MILPRRRYLRLQVPWIRERSPLSLAASGRQPTDWGTDANSDHLPVSSVRARERLALAGIFALAFALRLVYLGAESLWYDETVSVFLAGQPPGELIAHTARDIHPPLYYLLLRGWLVATGFPTGQADLSTNSLEFIAAFLSAWWGVLLVALSWRLARRLSLPAPSPLIAALLVAVSPFGVWYSQEVRMYTLGACLGVIILLTTTTFLAPAANHRALRLASAGYALAAAAGLYALYYFAFLLLAVNLLVMTLLSMRLLSTRTSSAGRDAIGRKTAPAALRPLAWWIAAQGAALLLYLPWLPVAWRQATDPPVPPWRSAPQLGTVIVESMTALTFGQSWPLSWVWPLLVIGLIGITVVIAWRQNREADMAGQSITTPGGTAQPAISFSNALALLVTAALGPPVLILLASAITPLYHIRYLFTFSPAFGISLGLGLAVLWGWHPPGSRWLSAGILAVLLLGSAASLFNFWTNSDFTTDDHRTAVQELAVRWRPGDLILVNAGYAYPALLTYWPLPVTRQGRLSEFQFAGAQPGTPTNGATILQTGHVDGAAGLGWDDPLSDFYAIPEETVRQKLDEAADSFLRLWHYRIYDTVNDPDGVVRDALNEHWTLVDDRVYRGEANMRIQGWQPVRRPATRLPEARFDSRLVLEVPPKSVPSLVATGDYLDVPGVIWTPLRNGSDARLSVSVRLVDEHGEVWAAHDEVLGGNQLDTTTAEQIVQPLRLAISPGTPPWSYRLEVVVYDAETGEVVPAIAGSLVAGARALLGNVQVVPAATTPSSAEALADFGPLRLVDASSPATTLSPGDTVPISLLWQAAPDFSGTPLVVVVQLLNDAGEVIASLEEEPLAGQYPTAEWQPGQLVQDRHMLSVAETTAAGTYQLVVGLYETGTSKRLKQPADAPGYIGKDHLEIQEIRVR